MEAVMPRSPNKPGEPVKGGSGYKPVTAWKHAPGVGWQHGRLPAAPAGLTAAGRAAWKDWLTSWWAAFYSKEDLPGLRLAIKCWDMAMEGWPSKDLPAPLLPLLDKYGLTPKGRNDLRWLPFEDDGPAAAPVVDDQLAAKRAERGAKLA